MSHPCPDCGGMLFVEPAERSKPMVEHTPRRFGVREDSAAAKLLDTYAPIQSIQLGLQNRIEWERRSEMTTMLRAVEEEALADFIPGLEAIHETSTDPASRQLAESMLAIIDIRRKM